MPRYDEVPKAPQLPSKPASTVGQREPWVPVTTTIPESLRRELTIACAVHNIKLKDAITSAVKQWLMQHPA
jgi:hypothetical protein